ncbi:hypothetical protein BKA59DRAFT_449830 [Fusarium tricinctum]|uniref:Hypervirulence associated protein TUDOR domain-containing protein n=1 Tax=Fusarium tricinctum TaxID=61284 RepID=A0A8K0SC78_9HYPO|nr:hypothetical protein BKA59DRAFT_449830 [Fusarium tricinctum]
MKGNDEVIQEFNELVNMTASDLEKWLKSDDSNSAGWPKEDENGETVGHDSGRKIVEILKENPKKDPKKYTDEQVQHMRKVVSYCKRHLAQETKSNNDKSPEEVKKTKSYASLKNWGHDFLKAQGKQNGSSKKDDEEDNEEEEVEEEEEADEDAEEEQEENDDEEKNTGEKRRATRSQTGANKKRETRKGESTKANDDDEEEEEVDDDSEKKQTQKKQSNGKKSKGSTKKSEQAEDDDQEEDDGGDGSGAKNGPKKGDTVSWNWGQGQPKGKVLDVKAEDTSITTKNGNQVSRKGDEEDPAVILDTGKNKAIKKAHELN